MVDDSLHVEALDVGAVGGHARHVEPLSGGVGDREDRAPVGPGRVRQDLGVQATSLEVDVHRHVHVDARQGVARGVRDPDRHDRLVVGGAHVLEPYVVEADHEAGPEEGL